MHISFELLINNKQFICTVQNKKSWAALSAVRQQQCLQSFCGRCSGTGWRS